MKSYAVFGLLGICLQISYDYYKYTYSTLVEVHHFLTNLVCLHLFHSSLRQSLASLHFKKNLFNQLSHVVYSSVVNW